MSPDKDRFGGSLTMQVDPVVVSYLTEIQRAQHNHDDATAHERQISLLEYVTDYQVKSLFRKLPDWARP